MKKGPLVEGQEELLAFDAQCRVLPSQKLKKKKLL